MGCARRSTQEQSFRSGDNDSYLTVIVNSTSGIWHNYLSVSKRAVPTVYLKSSVTITGGKGTKTDPYTLGI